tara:strand:- start:638 stop:838 length:201 start_codon:yes stop_codon:yes gene_type:complete
LIARQVNHAAEAARKTRGKAILLAALLEVLVQLPPKERLALLVYLGRKRARKNNGEEKGINEGDVG